MNNNKDGISLIGKIRLAYRQFGFRGLCERLWYGTMDALRLYDAQAYVKNTILKPSLDLQGWLSNHNQKALEKIVRQYARKNMRVLEVGSWKGLSTSILAKVAQENAGIVYCVDTWQGNEGAGGAHKQARARDVFSIFRSNMKILGFSGCVYPLYMNSAAAFEILKDNSFDVIFVDADHRYNAVIADVRACLCKIKPGGVICGDDCEAYYNELPANFVTKNADVDFAFYNEKGYHCGVIKALWDLWGTDYVLEKSEATESSASRFWWKEKR